MKSSSSDAICLPTLEDKPSRLIFGDESRCAGRQPLISVVIPTYRRADLLRQTLDSVLSQPGIEDAEIVVSDNNPEEDDTLRMMCKEYRRDNLLYYKHSCNLEGAGNWNRMVMLAHGKWCVMLHDDDMMLPGRLPLFLKVAEVIPQASLISFPIVEFQGNEPYSGDSPMPSSAFVWPLRLEELICRNYIYTCCPLFKRESWLAVGGLDVQKRFAPCPDYELWLRMTRRYRETWLCNVPAGAYRWLENDSLNPLTIQNIVARNLEFQLANTKGMSHWDFLRTISLSYEYLRRRLAQIGMSEREISSFYEHVGFPELSLWERGIVFLCKSIIRLRQRFLPVAKKRVFTL